MEEETIKSLRRFAWGSRVKFPVRRYTLTYRCTSCGHQWSEVSFAKNESTECRMGCNRPSLRRLVNALLTGKAGYGYGELIRWEEFEAYL